MKITLGRFKSRLSPVEEALGKLKGRSEECFKMQYREARALNIHKRR